MDKINYDNCMICGKEIDYNSLLCCNGNMCGCQGLPVDPPVCSKECNDILLLNQCDDKIIGNTTDGVGG